MRDRASAADLPRAVSFSRLLGGFLGRLPEKPSPHPQPEYNDDEATHEPKTCTQDRRWKCRRQCVLRAYLKSYLEIFSSLIATIWFVGMPFILYATVRVIAPAVMWVIRGFKAGESN